ncbi:beta-ketoacyl synthase N-terminal-like domain-containing protein, partial [Priestia megaterium]|uniref:beta-ketoacyl synthase N-terminal-like domain-containing protein n=1 Tax=Priestia megaterium TaxID=1404 RepID=UPI0012D8963A
WGYWGSVGIVSNDEYNKRMERHGIQSIEPSEGMEVIHRLLNNNDINQIIPLKADNKVLKILGLDYGDVSKPDLDKDCSTFMDLSNKIREDLPDSTRVTEFQSSYAAFRNFCRYSVLSIFNKMGIFYSANESYHKEDLRKQLKIIDKYKKLFNALLHIMEEAKFIEIDSQYITTTTKIENLESKNELSLLSESQRKLMKDYPSIKHYVELLSICLKDYPLVLTGQKNYTEVMFPKGSKTLVENIYKGNESADFYNLLVAKLVRGYINKSLEYNPNEKINIVEIGAGTGGTTNFVLKEIKNFSSKICYYYTDISSGFTRYGQKEFGSDYPFIEFKVLDIESSPEKQGFKSESIDLIFCSNVLHATKKVNTTLTYIENLLKPNGLIVINEITKVAEFATLTFGLTDGWWLFEDEDVRLNGSPLLSIGTWRHLLNEKGFQSIDAVGVPGHKEESLEQAVIFGEKGKVPIKKVARSSKGGVLNHREIPVSTVDKGNNLTSVVVEYIKKTFSKVLKIKEDKIQVNLTFENYGIDSLVTLEITKEFEKDFSRLPATLLFEYPTVEKLAEYFTKAHPRFVEKLIKDNYSKDSIELSNNNTQTIQLDIQNQNDNQGSVRNSDMNYNHSFEEVTIKQPSLDNYLNHPEDVAIIGLSGKYPMSSTLDGLWNNLQNGMSCISEIPSDRWDLTQYYEPGYPKEGKSYSKWGGFIEDIDKFDPRLFNLSPREAELIDPQERLFLETAWTLFEDAGLTRKSLAQFKHRVGAFVGVTNGNYVRLGGNPVSYWSIANRVSYYFNLQGPSLAVDTACSSSLT